MPNYHKLKNKGFTLLELLLALGIIGIITVFALSITYSSKSIGKTNDTKRKMRQIAKVSQDYYRGHGDLPAPAGTGNNEVPVAVAELNLEQTARLDGWGRYFHYNRSAAGADPDARTNIVGLTVNSKDVAGVIVSGGPDQTIDPSNMSSPYATTGDDIVLGINVSEQALETALNDLRVLQIKAQAFDAIFSGVDNNSTGGVDEHGCVYITECPIGPITIDPSCGSETLDNIIFVPAGCGYTTTTATAFIVNFYSLTDSYKIDPWLNEYIWGGAYGPGDPRFHKFFSAGPDRNPGTADDIIP